jgi:hypothetical protein
MSKVSFSRELLGTIRFIFDKTKSRTLNATQAYDISTSQIVLGSFPASATKKLLTKDLEAAEKYALGRDGTVAVTLTYGGGLITGTGLGKADQKAEPAITVPTSATVGWKDAYGDDFALKKSKIEGFSVQANTACFAGTSADRGRLSGGAATKFNAAKDIFYGAITVGTGLYRTWQGKYAVLKVDLLTNKAILRVYNE